jgi:hypothetical protein
MEYFFRFLYYDRLTLYDHLSTPTTYSTISIVMDSPAQSLSYGALATLRIRLSWPRGIAVAEVSPSCSVRAGWTCSESPATTQIGGYQVPLGEPTIVKSLCTTLRQFRDVKVAELGE